MGASTACTHLYLSCFRANCNAVQRPAQTLTSDGFCRVKFGAFYEYLESQQDQKHDRIASGHYARLIRHDGAGQQVQLALAPDAVKDQTYFLAHLTQQQLSKVMFPLGHLTKVNCSSRRGSCA